MLCLVHIILDLITLTVQRDTCKL